MIILGSLGFIIYVEGIFYKIFVYFFKDIVDVIGCGDIYVIGYLYMCNKGVFYEEVGCFVVVMLILKLEVFGFFSKIEEDVWNIIWISFLKVEKI